GVQTCALPIFGRFIGYTALLGVGAGALAAVFYVAGIPFNKTLGTSSFVALAAGMSAAALAGTALVESLGVRLPDWLRAVGANALTAWVLQYVLVYYPALIAFQASFDGSACAFSHRLTVETVTAISWANSSCVMLSCWRRVRIRLRVLSAMPATRATDVPRDTRPRARPHVAGAAAERRKAGGPTKTRRALLARQTMTSLWRPHDLRSRGTRGGRRQDGRARRAGAHGLAARRRGAPAGPAPRVRGARPRHRRELSGRLAHRRPRLGGLGRARGAHLERRRVASTRRDGPAGRDREDPPA